ncbi:hypothetical protein SISNIDRAFT_491625 [Sistotremastrum niveocremeum HHB9708]|uniref:DUF6532 domain-containing protein n=1 Tax=Sistotremastrum niveocremeum HHB9708 TaxID=1314777 RepID=A0A164MLA2_9AGAM|nr:hypothetical protein SISNIDRAFT_491625 [Sistotremastrum niveocremeum HHB9708]
MKPLIELGQFTFEDHTDPDNAIMYANPALAAILRQAVFKKGRLGEYFQEEFELDVRFELIAAAATVMEHILDEYVNGFFTKVKWSSERYLGVWESHLQALDDLANSGTNPMQTSKNLCKRIMKDVFIDLNPWRHRVRNRKARYSDEAIKRAADAMAQIVDSDDEPDNGMLED